MFPLFETIRISDGAPMHLAYHNARLNASRRALWNCHDDLDLRRVVLVPESCRSSIHRCRVTYGEDFGEIAYSPYTPKPIASLAIVDADGIDYSHKYCDRGAIEALLSRAGTDDILIVRNGSITDSSIANILFFDGSAWVTPANPLLPGTTRARLIDEGRVFTRDIRNSDLATFSRLLLINAMLDFDERRAIPLSGIV